MSLSSINGIGTTTTATTTAKTVQNPTLAIRSPLISSTVLRLFIRYTMAHIETMDDFNMLMRAELTKREDAGRLQWYADSERRKSDLVAITLEKILIQFMKSQLPQQRGTHYMDLQHTIQKHENTNRSKLVNRKHALLKYQYMDDFSNLVEEEEVSAKNGMKNAMFTLGLL